MSNHSLSVSSWPALGRSKHSSRRVVYVFLWPSLLHLCCVLCLKNVFEQSGPWRAIPTSFQKILPVLGVRMGKTMQPWRSCLFIRVPPPRCPEPTVFARQISSGAGYGQHTSHCLSQGLLAAMEVRCCWLTHNYGGQKNVDVLAKSILWRPLSFPNTVSKRYF